MAGHLPKPTEADLKNTKVKLRHWRKDKRYSRLKIIVSGYTFVYDQQDACWRRLDIKRERPKEHLSTAEKQKAKEARLKKRAAANKRAQRRKKFQRAAPEWLTTRWFKSGSMFGVLMLAMAINAFYLPAYPIVAFVIGGSLTCLGFYFVYALLGGPEGQNQPFDSGRFGLALILGIPALFPFFGMWGLHTLFVELIRLT